MQTDDALSSWADLMPGLVVNRPRFMAVNSSKPFQCTQIQKFFEVPRTLITTDPAQVHEFRKECGAVIYKSISSVRSIVAQLMPEDTRIEDVVWCPTQFQELIRGVDYRVHVVGGDVFACRILSNADDYRYAGRHGHTADIESCEIPAEVAQSCIDVSHDMGLVVSGVDLRQSEDGRWYCFEVNPSPGFEYFQRTSGQDIASSVARLLSG
jgi:glutathione synthase/RimK-type ligase-like ATP-grasp enzyme